MPHKPQLLPEWKEYLKACLDASQFLALGTSSEVDGAWVNTVFFNYDERFTLYFISEPSCIHMQNIERDSRVSCAIFSSAQDPHGKVLGLQLIGKASWVGPEEAEHACAAYFKETAARKPMQQANRSEEYVRPATVWRIAKIVPERVWTFDEKNFGGTRVLIPPEVFN